MPAMKFTTSSDCATLDEAVTVLGSQGWVVLAPQLLVKGVRRALLHFGEIAPQYDGKETWEVMVRPGFESLPYSQSSNGIGAHTEAPVFAMPPKYLALHCLRQAKCGGGHTMLADGLDFCERTGMVETCTRTEVNFVATVKPGTTQRQSLLSPLLSAAADGPIFRFSYNLFKYGDVNPSEDAIVSPDAALNQNSDLVLLTELAEKYFDEHGAAVLVPEGSMLIWNNHRMMHSRSRFEDKARHLTRYWLR